MLTKALAQNLVAIGMADMIQRAYLVACNCIHCRHGPHGCCQEQNVDVLAQVLKNLGAEEKVIYGE